MDNVQEIMLRKLKLANDLLGNCGIGKELVEKYPDRESLELFLKDYKKYLKAVLRMFDELLRENAGGITTSNK